MSDDRKTFWMKDVEVVFTGQFPGRNGKPSRDYVQVKTTGEQGQMSLDNVSVRGNAGIEVGKKYDLFVTVTAFNNRLYINLVRAEAAGIRAVDSPAIGASPIKKAI